MWLPSIYQFERTGTNLDHPTTVITLYIFAVWLANNKTLGNVLTLQLERSALKIICKIREALIIFLKLNLHNFFSLFPVSLSLSAWICVTIKHKIGRTSPWKEELQKWNFCSKAAAINNLVFHMTSVKVLFTDCCRRQNFRPHLLCLVDRLYTVIHKTQQTRTKVLPSVTVDE